MMLNEPSTDPQLLRLDDKSFTGKTVSHSKCGVLVLGSDISPG
jgi:hypothetical protein